MVEDLKSRLFRMQLLTLAWMLLTNIQKCEVGHAQNRRSMFSGGNRQNKATRLGLAVHPGEEGEKPPRKKSQGSAAFRIFVAEYRFQLGCTAAEHDVAVQVVSKSASRVSRPV